MKTPHRSLKLTPHPAAPRRWSRRRVLSALPVAAGGVLGLVATPRPPGAQAAQLTKGGYGTFIVAVGAETVSYNPNLDASPITQLLAPNIFSRLLSLDSAFRFIPDLARSWEVSDDGLAYTFVLEPPVSTTNPDGATWHDGEPVTSRDVQFTFEQILATPGALAQPALVHVSSVEASEVSGLNATPVVTFTLSEPDPAFLTTLATHGTFILPAHIYQQGSDWTTNPANQAPVGSGPFQFLSATPGTTVDLGAHHAYFGPGPYLDQVIYQLYSDAGAAQDALVNGEIDLIAGPLPPAGQFPLLAQAPGIVIDSQAAPEIAYLGFNLARDPVAAPGVRRALAGVLDRDAIVTAALGGFGEPVLRFTPPPSPDPGGAPGETTTLPTLSQADAAAQLDAAGLTGGDGTRLTLTMPYPAEDVTLGAIATAVREQLAPLAVGVELVPLPAGDWRERLGAGDFDLTVIAQAIGGTAGALAALVGSHGLNNFWRFADGTLDAAVAAAPIPRMTVEPAPVDPVIEETLRVQLPVVPLVMPRAPVPHTARALGLPFGPRAGEVALNRYALVRWRLEDD